MAEVRSFIPAATCDAVYYVDSFDRRRFIRLDYIFDHAHKERMAELKHIASSLGARRSYSAMSQKAACAIDNALGKLGFIGSMNMVSQQQKESKSTLYFTVEF